MSPRPPPAYCDPLAAVDWDALAPDRPWLPDDLVSLAGDPAWEQMTPAARIALSQLEFLALIDLGLWLESYLLRALGRAAPSARRVGAETYAAQLHELREEAGHSLMFLEILRRAPHPLPPVPRPRLVTTGARLLPGGSGMFWAAVLIGETVAVELNRRIRDSHTIPDTIRHISEIHLRDEARHVAYARQRVAEAIRPRPHPAAGAALRVLAGSFLATCFHPPAALYHAAGLPGALAASARANPIRNALAAACLAPAGRYLARFGLPL
ncbi:MAG: diiron oxygenase [Acetobacteraceae bacterium]